MEPVVKHLANGPQSSAAMEIVLNPVAGTAKIKSKTTRADRYREMCNRLLEAVDAYLADGISFNDISVEFLAADAGVSRTTFYVYFADKAALLASLTEDVVTAVSEQHNNAFDLIGTEAASKELAEALYAGMVTWRQHADLLAAALVQAPNDAALTKRNNEQREALSTRLSKRIKAGQSKGVVRPDLVPDLAARLIVGTSEHAHCTLVDRSATDAALHDIADSLASLIWHALHAGR